MPTADRRAFVPAAIDCFLRQTYAPIELVILDSGKDRVKDLIPVHDRIRYIGFEGTVPNTGILRNMVNEAAEGKLICHWDDDDWSSPDRIRFQADFLKSSSMAVTGFSNLFFWDCLRKRAMQYKTSVKGYVVGTSLCYTKDFWKIHQFKDKQIASDSDFVYSILRQIAESADMSHMVARIHDLHTSSKANISEIIDRELIPAGFWENEKLRMAQS